MRRAVPPVIALLLLVCATPAVADEPYVDLAVTIEFDKPSYLASEAATATITVTNNGTAPAHDVHVVVTGNEPFVGAEWPLFRGPGFDVEPGAAVQESETEDVFDADVEMSVVAEATSAEPDRDASDNDLRVTAPVARLTGNLTGTVYRDFDADRQVDPGEEMRGIQVRTANDLLVRTDEHGRFRMADLREGRYSLELGLPAGWQEDRVPVADVHAGENEVFIRLVPQAEENIRASITFDRTEYAVGDTVREHVTISNKGVYDLSGVTARCVEGAGPNTLSGLGWGDLVHYEKPGIALKAGETRTFDFTDVVPAGGKLYGFITLTCWFSNVFRYDDGPAIVARAEVPGGVGSTGGHLFQDRNDNHSVDRGEGVAGTKLFLMTADGQVVARGMTDATGHFWFRNLPANQYELRISGPWRFVPHPTVTLGVFDGNVLDSGLYPVAPGPTQPDLDAPPSTGPSVVDVVPAPTPQPKAARPANLADTGADVVELAGLGALLMVVGAALLFVRRPRASS